MEKFDKICVIYRRALGAGGCMKRIVLFVSMLAMHVLAGESSSPSPKIPDLVDQRVANPLQKQKDEEPLYSPNGLDVFNRETFYKGFRDVFEESELFKSLEPRIKEYRDNGDDVRVRCIYDSLIGAISISVYLFGPNEGEKTEVLSEFTVSTSVDFKQALVTKMERTLGENERTRKVIAQMDALLKEQKEYCKSIQSFLVKLALGKIVVYSHKITEQATIHIDFVSKDNDTKKECFIVPATYQHKFLRELDSMKNSEQTGKLFEELKAVIKNYKTLEEEMKEQREKKEKESSSHDVFNGI